MQKLNFATLVARLSESVRGFEEVNPIYVSRCTKNGEQSQIFDVILGRCKELLEKSLTDEEYTKFFDILFPVAEFNRKKRELGLDQKNPAEYADDKEFIDKEVNLWVVINALCDVVTVK